MFCTQMFSAIEVYVSINIHIFWSVFSSIEVYLSINIYVLQSDVFIYSSTRIFFSKHLYSIDRCFRLQKSMCQKKSIFYGQMFSSIQECVYSYIFQSDVFIDKCLCINISLYFIICIFQLQKSINIRLYFRASVFIYRSLCVNIHLYFMVSVFI